MEDKRNISTNPSGADQIAVVKSVTFWRWLTNGSGGLPGIRRIVNRWLIVHFLIGVVLAAIVPIDLQAAASAVLLPLAGVLVGLSFAWAGNAQALLQTQEIESLSDFHPGGFIEYVYLYSLAILCILVTLAIWSLAGLRVFDAVWPTALHHKSYIAIKLLLFTLSSITPRECWHIVLAAQWMLLTRREIVRKKQSEQIKGTGT